jgi:hypothetical protein
VLNSLRIKKGDSKKGDRLLFSKKKLPVPFFSSSVLDACFLGKKNGDRPTAVRLLNSEILLTSIYTATCGGFSL